MTGQTNTNHNDKKGWSSKSLVAATVFAIGMILATGNVLVVKQAYLQTSIGSDGVSKLFKGGWLMTLIMFMGMFIVPVLAILAGEAAYRVRTHFGWVSSSRSSSSSSSSDYHRLEEMEEDHLLAQDFAAELALRDGDHEHQHQHYMMGEREQEEAENEIELTIEAATRGLNRKSIVSLAVPAIFDLTATFLYNASIMNLDASMAPLFRSTIIVFTAIAKVTLLKGYVSLSQWAGVGIVFLSLIVGSLSAVMPTGEEAPTHLHNHTHANATQSPSASASSSNNNSAVMLGIMFMVLSSLVQTGQFVAVENMLKRGSSSSDDINEEGDNNEDGKDAEEEVPVHPYTACALQGFWGTIFCCVLVLPISGALGAESWADDLSMLAHSKPLLALGLLYMTVIGFSNIASTVIMLLLDSVYVTILSNSMPSTVWASELFIHYVVDPSTGESWNSTGYLHIGSILLMGVGVAFYAGLLALPVSWTGRPRDEDIVCFDSEETSLADDEEEGGGGYTNEVRDF